MYRYKKSCIFLMSLLLVAVFTFQAFAAVPDQINYQGKLTDDKGMPILNTSYTLTFRIFDAVSGGSLLWAEDQTVSVTGGIYNVILGQGTTTAGSFGHTLFSVDNRWLEVVVEGEVLSPRQRVTSVAYAFNSETLDGHPSGDFASAGHSHTETDPTVLSSVKDGVSWAEVTGKPGGFADNIDDVGVSTETDPTVPAAVKDGISWDEVASKPAGFADNTDNIGIASESDPTVLPSVKDGISWSEIANRPAGLDDGDDIGGTPGPELVIDTLFHDWSLGHSWDAYDPDFGFFYIKDETNDKLRLLIDKDTGEVSTGDLKVFGRIEVEGNDAFVIKQDSG
ncbi:hypothetical protein VU12_15310, partial [Desulfobulbus sp. US4]|nr:hypothetical protein [Desulfobulbus sp. US4]